MRSHIWDKISWSTVCVTNDWKQLWNCSLRNFIPCYNGMVGCRNMCSSQLWHSMISIWCRTMSTESIIFSGLDWNQYNLNYFTGQHRIPPVWLRKQVDHVADGASGFRRNLKPTPSCAYQTLSCLQIGWILKGVQVLNTSTSARLCEIDIVIDSEM